MTTLRILKMNDEIEKPDDIVEMVSTEPEDLKPKSLPIAHPKESEPLLCVVRVMRPVYPARVL